MFRSTKRKPKVRKVLRTASSADAEEDYSEVDNDGGVPRDVAATGNYEEQKGDDYDNLANDDTSILESSSSVKWRKKKFLRKGKRGGLVVRSFEMDDNIDEVDRRMKKKQKRVFGFGGGQEEVDDDIDEDAGQPSYRKEALEALRLQQKVKKTKIGPSHPPYEYQQGETTLQRNSNIKSTSQSESEKDVQVEEDVFIQLNDRSSCRQDHIAETNDNEPRIEHEQTSLEDPEETTMWEDQIERRAGIKFSSDIPKSSSSSIPSKLISLEDLSQNLQSTIESIETRRDELNHAVNRREADRDHAISESRMQQKTLEETGAACEYYQKLRHDLTVWVGAIRDLQSKVHPVLEAFQDMLQIQNEDIDIEFRSLQDDCIGILKDIGLLNCVLGRHSDIPTTDGVPTIDEFGRDVRSQYLRDRDNRFQKRRQKIESSANSETSITWPSLSYMIQSMYEDHDERQRCEALHEAMKAVFHDLDQDFTNSQNLRHIFDNWRSKYADDYEQCYAALSLGDLLSALLLAGLCKSSWFPDILSKNGPGNIDPKFPDELNNFLTNQVTAIEKEDHESFQRAVEKSLLPVILDLFRKSPNINVFLLRNNSRHLSSLVGLTSKWIEDSQNHLAQLHNVISDSMKDVLNGIAIPVLKIDHNANNEEDGFTESFAVKFANQYIVQIVQELLCNMIMDWFPLLPLDEDGGENGIHFVLNFINDKLLMLLSSLGSGESSLNKEVFGSVWKALKHDSRKLLENPSLMLITTPLRAAKFAYQPEESNKTGLA
jgi:hypothetical protein